MKILLANSRGFCAGVDRAIEIVKRALNLFEQPIYVRHEVVHNKYVVDQLKQKGAIFVAELDEVPDGSLVIFSAHGVAASVRAESARRGLKVLDATCPLVTKVHIEVIRYAQQGCEVILIGHAKHPEVVGTMGQYDCPNGGIYLVESATDAAAVQVKNAAQLAYVSQTTLSIDDTQEIITILQQRFPAIIGPRKDDICYATQNRQNAVKALAETCDLILVVGSPNSSNSTRLYEIAKRSGVKAYLVEQADKIEVSWLTGSTCIGVTAGASAPEALVQAVIVRLQLEGDFEVIDQRHTLEEITFSLPRELLASPSNSH